MRKAISNLQSLARKLALATGTAGLVIGSAAPALAIPNSVSLELGDARISEVSTYDLDMSNVDTATSLQCIEVNLNTAADGTGSVPAGLTSTSSTLDSSTLVTAGSWTVDNTTNGLLRITNSSGENPSASGNVIWDNVTNGNTANTTYYGVISTYTDDSCTILNEQVSVAYVYTNGQLVEVTVDPALTFTINPVSSGDATGDETTTVTSTDGSVPFGNTVAGSNEVAAHDLDVSTNAADGYTVYVRDTDDLRNTTNSSAIIDNHSGTNAAPSALAGTGEEFGYHTDGMSQFNAGEYAGFTQSNEPVMQSATAAAGTDSARVTYQVGVASDTEAGTYQTTLIYTMVPVY